MGREVRRVPANWEHPKRTEFDHQSGKLIEVYQPLYDRDYETVMSAWMEKARAWLDGGFAKCRADHPELKYGPNCPYSSLADWDGEPPRKAYYRPLWAEEPTWFQVYETVSEGTPVTPPFATAEELIEYLVAKGDFWDQKRGHGGWSRENAEAFVGRGFAMTMLVSGGVVKMARDGI